MPLFRRNRNHHQQPQQQQQHDNSTSQQDEASNPQQFAQQAATLIPAEVRMISGCHSEQTSADVSNVNCVQGKLPQPAGRAGGACTSALLALLYKNTAQTTTQKPLTFQQVLVDLRESLAKSGFDQIPQLTSSRPLEVKDTPFSLVGTDYGLGVRRAVLVGINYRGQSGQLSGCHNDVLNVKKYIIEQQGYLEENILVLIDDGQHHYPTREKIIRALRQLVAQSVSGDSVYFHYSGHGGLLSPDWNVFKSSSSNNKEYDETLYPMDHDRAGQIRDFSLFNHFVKPMAAGVTVTCVMDCCHSGSVLDLPYCYQPTSAGTIRMRSSMGSLSNLAFLYILAGGMLPPFGFENVTDNIEDATGGNIDDYQGTGLEEMTNDTEAADYADAGDGGDYGEADTDATDYVDSGEDVDVADAEDYGGGADDGDYGGADTAGDVGTSDYVVSGDDVYTSDYDGGDRGYGDTGGGGDYTGGDTGGVDYSGGGDGGFGDTGFMGGDDGGGGDFDGGMDGGDTDCGCLQDILGALMDGD